MISHVTSYTVDWPFTTSWCWWHDLSPTSLIVSECKKLITDLAPNPNESMMLKWIAELESPKFPYPHDAFISFATYHGMLLGTAWAFQWKASPPPRDDWDLAVVVDPGVRRRGVGRELVLRVGAEVVKQPGETDRPNGEMLRYYTGRDNMGFFDKMAENSEWQKMQRVTSMKTVKA